MRSWVLICFLLFGLFLSHIDVSKAQGVLPVHRYHRQLILDKDSVTPSFAYSLRKMKRKYTGFALRVRKDVTTLLAVDPEGDVAFDSAGKVSDASNVTITSIGTGYLFPGQVVRLGVFRGADTLYIKTWYDQGANGYHASQTTAAQQPILLLNTAGGSNTKPSIVFAGSKWLSIPQPITSIFGNGGIAGSFLLWTRLTANSNQFSFGRITAGVDWRWSLHLNWSDGYLYFDAGEYCCGNIRSVNNSANLNLYTQYCFVRSTTYKTVRINNISTAINNTAIASVTPPAGSPTGFYIGWAQQDALRETLTYQGNVCEVLMFPTALPTTRLDILERDQMAFWSN